MCGITGFFGLQTTLDAADLDLMTRVLAHRGPDAQGVLTGPGWGLGHRRLSVIDLSDAANQPMRSHDGRYVLVYNGEIYNFQDVARDLDVPLRTHSDTEVVLEAFAAWGPVCFERFNGMFALAVIDTHRSEIILARDRLGIKPLFYRLVDGELVFGSELKAITSLRVRGHVPNPSAIAAYLHLGFVPEPMTILAHTHKLPSGTWLRFDGHRLEAHTFWRPEAQLRPHATRDPVLAKQQLAAIVDDAVRARLIADVPVGTFLSGGIDSSLVTALTQKHTSHRVKTFSIGFSEARFDESPYAEAVAQHLDTDHHPFRLSQEDAKSLVVSLLDVYDEPYADSSAIPTMMVSKLARQHVTVALSGDGGDELMLGYNMYQWAQRLGHPLLRHGRALLHTLLRHVPRSRWHRLSTFLAPHPERFHKTHVFSQVGGFFSYQELHTMLRISYGYPPMNEHVDGLARDLNLMEQQSLFDLRAYLKDDLLVKVDRASMLHSLEVRVPLLDHRVVAFCLNLHPDLKIRHGATKWLLKSVLYDHVPASLFDRPKAGFSVPLQLWLREDLRYLIDDYLNPDVINAAGLVNANVVAALVQRFDAGIDHLYARVWTLILLHKWYLEQVAS